LRQRSERGTDEEAVESGEEIDQSIDETNSASSTEVDSGPAEASQLQEEDGAEEDAEPRSSSDSGPREDITLLLPPLPNSLVRRHIWPRLVNQWQAPQDLVSLTAINHLWQRFVESTLEWHAANFVRLDMPGYHDYIQRRQGRSLPLIVRLRLEIRNFQYLVAERLEYFQIRRDRVPSYVSMTGCPPDYEQDPTYYDL
jgi:hypothetical protein